MFCITYPRVYVGDPSVLCFREILVPKNIAVKRGGESTFSVENILSHSAENFPRVESLDDSLTSGIENVWIRKCRENKVFC